MKIFLRFVEGDDQDYNNLLKTNKLKDITIPQFKNFIKNQTKDCNYIYQILSVCLIEVKKEYLKQFNKEKNELNYLIIEPIISQCFTIIMYNLDKEDN